MSKQTTKKRRKQKILGTAERPRLVTYRSLNNIYGQIIDDSAHKTLVAASTLSKDLRKEIKKAKTRVEISKIVGEHLAKKALEKNIKKVIFDRNGYKYHGRVKALAEGARESGLEF